LGLETLERVAEIGKPRGGRNKIKANRCQFETSRVKESTTHAPLRGCVLLIEEPPNAIVERGRSAKNQKFKRKATVRGGGGKRPEGEGRKRGARGPLHQTPNREGQEELSFQQSAKEAPKPAMSSIKRFIRRRFQGRKLTPPSSRGEKETGRRC